MSDRIILRSLRATDKNDVFDLLMDPDVMAYLGPKRALKQNEAQQWFEDELLSPSRYVVALQGNDQLIGFCGVKVIAGINDFGYFLRKKFWSKGYASESCLLAIQKLQQEIDVSRLQIFIAKQNIGSLSLAYKLDWLQLSETIKDGEQGYYFQISI
jgi:[ribosomal protein S5]-alanine N-acetyltransferase